MDWVRLHCAACVPASSAMDGVPFCNMNLIFLDAVYVMQNRRPQQGKHRTHGEGTSACVLSASIVESYTRASRTTSLNG